MSRRPPKTNTSKPTVSVGLLLVALVIYALAQWGGLDLLNGAPPANPAPTGIIAGAPDREEPTATAKPKPSPTATRKARATRTPTTAANAPPSATAKAKATATPKPRATVKPTATTKPTAKPTARPTATAQTAPHAGDLPPIAYANLPPEAHDTIALIDAGGPFPFRRDGVTFQNRERILPRKPEGYYREYTVITPGEDDRGARRIVTGEDGEMYYTDDHYDSFFEIIRQNPREGSR
ncbi:MAG: hypothetical protein IT329_21950 [Caldilineaceae bacterium]|nr:hypothetical protein [Caldilineaceae bacterium]